MKDCPFNFGSVDNTGARGRPNRAERERMGKGGYRKGRKRPNDSGPGGYASRQKHANGEGDYPPEHVLENPAFETYYRESGIVPEAEWDAVWKPWPTRPASAAQAASGSCPRLAEAQGSLERDLALIAASGVPADARSPCVAHAGGRTS